MTLVRTVLCPVDFTPATGSMVRLAARLCRQTGARLVLHHNLGPAPPDFLGVHWMWDEEHGPEEENAATVATERLGRLFAGLPPDLEVEAKISRGPLEDGVLHLARRLPADLIVLANHGASSPEHLSLTEHVLLRAPCSVLALSPGSDKHTPEPAASAEPRRQRLLIATDLSGHDRGAVGLGFELATALAFEVHLVHVLKRRRKTTLDRRFSAAREARTRLAALVPDELAPHTHLHVRLGSPAEEILSAAADLDPEFLVLGARKHGPLHRALSGLTSLEVLHGSRWPVWFVPAELRPRRRSFGAA